MKHGLPSIIVGFLLLSASPVTVTAVEHSYGEVSFNVIPPHSWSDYSYGTAFGGDARILLPISSRVSLGGVASYLRFPLRGEDSGSLSYYALGPSIRVPILNLASAGLGLFTEASPALFVESEELSGGCGCVRNNDYVDSGYGLSVSLGVSWRPGKRAPCVVSAYRLTSVRPGPQDHHVFSVATLGLGYAFGPKDD